MKQKGFSIKDADYFDFGNFSGSAGSVLQDTTVFGGYSWNSYPVWKTPLYIF